MARYRLSEPAKADIAGILARSGDLHGIEARIRYRAALTAAMRHVAAEPEGPSTRDRAAVAPGLRNFHIRYSRLQRAEPPVARSVHVLFYRAVPAHGVEIVRVLHERMDPEQHPLPGSPQP